METRFCSLEPLGVVGRLNLYAGGREISMQPLNWPRASLLGALLTLTFLTVLSCAEEPAPKPLAPSPTAAPREASTPSPSPAIVDPVSSEAGMIAPTETSTPVLTSTVVYPVTCEKGLIVPKGSGCRVPWTTEEYCGIDEYELLFEVDLSGRANLYKDGLWHSSQDDYLEVISGCVNGDFFARMMLLANPNDDGSWTVEGVVNPDDRPSGYPQFVTPTPELVTTGAQ